MKLTHVLQVSMVIAALTVQAGCSRTDNGSLANSSNRHPTPASADPSGYQFEAPVRIKAGNEFVAVESPGYACPTMADVDGDGKEDLVVGQFKQGQMQFCKNISATGESPKFASATWIMSGKDRAIVPGVW